MNDGKPGCPSCSGTGSSQGRGQKHPCHCLHGRICDLIDGTSKLASDLIMKKARVAELEAKLTSERESYRLVSLDEYRKRNALDARVHDLEQFHNVVSVAAYRKRIDALVSACRVISTLDQDCDNHEDAAMKAIDMARRALALDEAATPSVSAAQKCVHGTPECHVDHEVETCFSQRTSVCDDEQSKENDDEERGTHGVRRVSDRGAVASGVGQAHGGDAPAVESTGKRDDDIRGRSGTGVDLPTSEAVPCPWCNGTGVNQRDGWKSLPRIDCGQCDGTGRSRPASRTTVVLTDACDYVTSDGRRFVVEQPTNEACPECSAPLYVDDGLTKCTACPFRVVLPPANDGRCGRCSKPLNAGECLDCIAKEEWDLENAFWTFDALHKAHYRDVKPGLSGPMSERGAFKYTLRKFLRDEDTQEKVRPPSETATPGRVLSEWRDLALDEAMAACEQYAKDLDAIGAYPEEATTSGYVVAIMALKGQSPTGRGA